ncbi:MAG TPA: hypothetical protein VN408_25810 [Actinoplanes sp.]|nr:hypothetical protein [Actinoplanes sp.]
MRPRTVLVVAAMLAVAGCSEPEFPNSGDFALPSSQISRPSTSGPGPARSVPPVTHRWRTDGLTCPVVTSADAQDVGVTGPGHLADTTDVTTIGNTITCLWTPAGRAESVTTVIDTSTVQEAADIAWQVRSAIMTEGLPGVGEQAFVSVLGTEITVLVRSGNATVSVSIRAKRGDADGLSKLRVAAPAIAGDMLGSLVPA